jgi:hypothetical protein
VWTKKHEHALAKAREALNDSRTDAARWVWQRQVDKLERWKHLDKLERWRKSDAKAQ